MINLVIKMLFIDVDGVLRDLAGCVFGKPARTWLERTCNGDTLLEAVNKDPFLCIRSKPTQYFFIIANFHLNLHRRIQILTSQPKPWRAVTEMWLDKYVGKYDVVYTRDSDEKLEYLEPGDYLIDDSPCFKRYDQIIMPDYMYNRHVEPLYRVVSPEEMAFVLVRLKL